MNNYDNTVRNSSRVVFEKFDVGKFGRRSDFGTMKSDPSEDFKVGRKASIGSAMGPGGRAFLYTCLPKKSQAIDENMNKTMDEIRLSQTDFSSTNGAARPTFKNKVDYKKTQSQTMKAWNHYDANINNNLVEQRKILYSKNYELDSRAWGLKDYGVQPYMQNQIATSRKIQKVLMTQIKGRSPDERLPQYKKNYTPITTYMKSIVDSRVTKEQGGKITSLRPNLNYS